MIQYEAILPAVLTVWIISVFVYIYIDMNNDIYFYSY